MKTFITTTLFLELLIERELENLLESQYQSRGPPLKMTSLELSPFSAAGRNLGLYQMHITFSKHTDMTRAHLGYKRLWGKGMYLQGTRTGARVRWERQLPQLQNLRRCQKDNILMQRFERSKLVENNPCWTQHNLKIKIGSVSAHVLLFIFVWLDPTLLTQVPTLLGGCEAEGERVGERMARWGICALKKF